MRAVGRHPDRIATLTIDAYLPLGFDFEPALAPPSD